MGYSTPKPQPKGVPVTKYLSRKFGLAGAVCAALLSAERYPEAAAVACAYIFGEALLDWKWRDR